jgi:hypothetical protein
MEQRTSEKTKQIASQCLICGREDHPTWLCPSSSGKCKGNGGGQIEVWEVEG